MKRTRVLFLVAVAAVWLPSRAGADIAQLVLFGDSLLDTGNVYAATGTPPSPYYNGRFSNGIVWNEYLAASLKIPAPTPSLLGGMNYAWGGAETGTGTSPQGGVPNVNTQVATFLSGHTLAANQLVILDGGANDFFDGKTDPTLPVNNLAAAITALAAKGGKQFLVQNIPDLGNVPGSLSLPQAQRDGLNALSQAYDSLLHARVAQLQSSLGVTIGEVDLATLARTVTANPGAYGFTKVTTSALGDGVTSGAGYLYWDDVHPTTKADQIIAAAALAAIPEPSPVLLALVGIGACGLVTFGRCRRSAGAGEPRALDGIE